MKCIINILLITALLVSCKKDSGVGTVIYKINFTTNSISLKSSALDSYGLYTNFGDYITSLTPAKLIAQIWTVGYIDVVFSQNNNNAQMLQYIEQNPDNLPMDSPLRIVDFSANSTVTFNPVLYGRVNNDRQFEDSRIDFAYFYFLPKYIYQEVQLPEAYRNIQPEMFPSGSVENNVLKVRHTEMLKKIFPNAQTADGFYFIFGNTESTFIVNPNGERVATSADNPISDGTNQMVIRSNKYVNMIYNAPAEGETVVMNGVLSIDSGNLIQVYAGADNIPYTKDDIFVYAPKFWERIYSRLDMN